MLTTVQLSVPNVELFQVFRYPVNLFVVITYDNNSILELFCRSSESMNVTAKKYYNLNNDVITTRMTTGMARNSER